MSRNYLAAGPLIIERLRERITEVDRNNIQATTDLADAQDTGRPTPAIDVYYAGDRALEGSDVVNSYQAIAQAWVVVIVAAKATGEPGEVLVQSGSLMTRVLQELNGWQPSPNHGRLERVIPGPRAITTRWGWQFTPVLFLTSYLTG